MSRHSHKIKIIAGRNRGQNIRTIDAVGFRPTTNQIRETLFNWLQNDVEGAHVLDLFAGSGALSFEALSRGAATAMLIEKNYKAVKMLQENAQQLNYAKQVTIRLGDAQQILKRLTQPYDLVFLDPPFQQNLLQPILNLLLSVAEPNFSISQAVFHPLLKPSTKIYLESAQPLTTIILPRSWSILREKKSGAVYYGLICNTLHE